MSPSRSRQPTLVLRWAKYGPLHWWCRIRWLWSTAIMMIILVNDWEECYQQSWRPPDGRRPPPEPYRPGDRWLLSLDCLKRLDCAFYKILVCRFPIYLFLLPFPQNSLLFYPNWPGDKLLVMLWAVFSEQGHSMHYAKFSPWLVWTVMEGSIPPRSPFHHPVAQRDRAAMFSFSHPAHLQSVGAAILMLEKGIV